MGGESQGNINESRNWRQETSGWLLLVFSDYSQSEK